MAERSGRGVARWTRESAIAAIKAYVSLTGRVPKQRDAIGNPDLPSPSIARTLGMTWSKLIEAAGFEKPRRGGRPGPMSDGHREAIRRGVLRSRTEVPPGVREARMAGLGLVAASAVEPRQMAMLWRERIPASTLTVIAGRSGAGKSTLGAFIAAELSRAGIPGIVSNMEDDLESVTRPRLEVAGADLEKVGLLPGDAAPTLPRDFKALEAMIVDFQARYVILDPVAAHFLPERRVHDRPTLMRLIRLAREHRCAVIALHHQIQSAGDGEALSKIGGPSGGLGGTARAAFLYGFDPDDEDRRALACAKINGVELPASLVFEHEVVEYESVGGQVIEAGVLRVHGESNATAKQTMRRGRKRKDRDTEAVEWLTRFLAGGEDCTRRATEVREWAGRDGIAWQTVLRARVSVKATRARATTAQGGGFGADGFWLWRLPDDHPMRVSEDAEVVPGA